MQLIKVSRETDQYNSIKKLYRQAFPLNERAPFWLLMRRAGSPSADFWALYDQKKWIGIAYVIQHGRLAYLFYSAICKEERNKGYGEKSIELLKEHYKGNCFFLALEKPDESAANYQQRLKRHAFYKKCGLSDMPYSLKEASVVYDIMGTGGSVEPEEYRELVQTYLGRFLSRIIDMRIIK